MLVLVCSLFASVGGAAASTAHDLTGTWECCGSGGASNQTWTITSMDKSSGAFSGTGDGGGIKMTITGTASGDSVTLTTDYDGSSYSATFKGTLSADSLSMSGDWESNSSQKGTWTAKRGAAPNPGDDPDAPKPEGPAGSKVKLIPGDVYVSDSSANVSGGAVYKVNPENGVTTLVHQGAPFVGVRGIAFGPDGDLYVANIGAGEIDRIDLAKGTVTRLTPFSPLMRNPAGIVYDPALGDFLVTDSYFGTLLRVDPKTGAVKKLLEYEDLKRAQNLALALGLGAFAPSVKGQGVVLRMSQAAGGWKASIFKKGLPAPFGIAIEATAAGSRFFVTDSSPQVQMGGVYSWLGNEKPELIVDDALIGTPAGLGLTPDGKTLYIGSTGTSVGTGSLIAMNVADRKLKTVTGGFVAPVSIAVAPPKKVTVAVGAGKTGTKATPTGVTTTVSSPAQPLAVTVSVSVNLPRKLVARASKAIKAKSVQITVPARSKVKARVPFKRSLANQIRAALKAGKTVKAKVTVKAVAPNGDTRKAVKRVQIKG